MKIYFKTVYEHLCSQFSNVELVHCSSYRYEAAIINELSAASADGFIISGANQFSTGRIPDAGIILVDNAPISLPESKDLIVISSDIDSSVVTASILSLFNKLLNWREHIYSSFYTGSSIQHIFQFALGITLNPIYAHDQNYRMFAYAEKRTNDKDWNYDFYSMGRLSPATISKLTSSPGFADTFKTTEPTYFERIPEIEDYNYLYINLRVNGKYAGRIFIDEKIRPITSIDYEIITALADILQISMSGINSQLPDIPDRTRDILNSLIEHNHLSDDDNAYLNDALNLTENTTFRCVYIDCPQDDVYYNVKLSIGDIITSRIKYCYPLIRREHILIVIFTENPKSMEYACNIISSIITEFGLKAGFSRSHASLSAIRYLYIQGEIASSYAASNQTLHFDDCSFKYILDCCSGKLPAEFAFPQPLNTLKEYDLTHGTEFIETLRVYLEENQSPSKSCERLYLHRSTFLYRLGRIQEIIGDDMSNPDLRLQYMLALKLIN